jgi:hypothetical protein
VCTSHATDACLAEAFAAVSPDTHPPCPAPTPELLLKCLADPQATSIILIGTLVLNTTLTPPRDKEPPLQIGRNVTLMADPRGPRMTLDCGLVSDRLQLLPNVTLTLSRLILVNCSIGAHKPLSVVRLSAGSRLLLNGTHVLQPSELCVPLQQQAGVVPHQARPPSVPGVQVTQLGQPGQWCARQPGTRTRGVDDAAPGGGGSGANSSRNAVAAAGAPTVDADGNSSYSSTALQPLPTEFANRTGLGPAYAATLDQPATTAYYAHQTCVCSALLRVWCGSGWLVCACVLACLAGVTQGGFWWGASRTSCRAHGAATTTHRCDKHGRRWPEFALCQQQVLLLRDFAYSDPYAWGLPPNTSTSAAAQLAAAAGPGGASSAASNQSNASSAPSPATQLSPGYNASVPVHYINSSWLCEQPSAACSGGRDPTQQHACLLAAYASRDPDAAYVEPSAGGGGPSYGVGVVLPAVLGSIGVCACVRVCGRVGVLCGTCVRARVWHAPTGIWQVTHPHQPNTPTPATHAQNAAACLAQTGGALLLAGAVVALPVGRRKHREAVARETLAKHADHVHGHGSAGTHSTPLSGSKGLAAWLGIGHSSAGTSGVHVWCSHGVCLQGGGDGVLMREAMGPRCCQPPHVVLCTFVHTQTPGASCCREAQTSHLQAQPRAHPTPGVNAMCVCVCVCVLSPLACSMHPGCTLHVQRARHNGPLWMSNWLSLTTIVGPDGVCDCACSLQPWRHRQQPQQWRRGGAAHARGARQHPAEHAAGRRELRARVCRCARANTARCCRHVSAPKRALHAHVCVVLL